MLCCEDKFKNVQRGGDLEFVIVWKSGTVVLF